MQVSENVMDKTKRLGEHQEFPPKSFLSHSAEYIVRRATLLCSVSEIFR